jgi:hypothetical protein
VHIMEVPEIEVDVPFVPYVPTFEDLQARVTAALRSVEDVYPDGLPVSDDNIQTARAVLAGAVSPTPEVLAEPGVVVHLKAILDEYDKEVVQSAQQIRAYVTNKLILDSTHPDPRVRLKCYEMLGKISDVGLFTDKTEVTMRHRPTAELEQLLRERLAKTLEAVPEALPAPEVPNVPVPELSQFLGEVSERSEQSGS